MLLAAANSIAMSLGRHRGAVLIGRPMDISVQAVLDTQDDIASLCLDADVFYADNKLDKSRIRVTAERAAAGAQDAVIRIRSTVPVDEPMVTVYLRVGCQQKTERRYVTLADLASETTPDKGLSPATGFPQLSPSQTPRASVALPSLAPQTSSLSATRPAKTTRRSNDPANLTDAELAGAPAQAFSADNLNNKSKKAALKSQRRAASPAASKPSAANGSRLKLEPLDLSIERDPRLKPSAEMSSSPASNTQERSAAAALWRAITAQPQDILKDSEKLQTLESSVRTLQVQSQKTQQSINELGVKLQKAESERYANALVYGLGFLLLLALAGLAYLMRGEFLRRRMAGGDAPWWRKGDGQQNLHKTWDNSGEQVDGFESAPLSDASKHKTNNQLTAGQVAADIDLNFTRSDFNLLKLNSGLDSAPAALPTLKPRADFALSVPQASLAAKAEELFDVQQQADFFVSIGQPLQAIEVLHTHIDEDVETSALVYLDLFNLYHQLERRDDYESLRADFNSRFNAEIPAFDSYTAAGPGLEAYQLAMSRIEALWPSSKVLGLIEESIFRRPETDGEAFNLEAYRELLMLHSVAKEIIDAESKSAAKPNAFVTGAEAAKAAPMGAAYTGGQRPAGFALTSIQPLSASLDAPAASGSGTFSNTLPGATVPPASLNLGLDVDLSEPLPASIKQMQGRAPRAEFPELYVAPKGDRKPEGDIDNLIDFDIFDQSAGANSDPKTPKGL